jgi:hypothetical protein
MIFLLSLASPLKLVRLIKMCLNETYRRVLVGKHLSDRFRINSGFKQADELLLLPLGGFRQTRRS